MKTFKIDLFHPVHLPEMEIAALDVLRSGQIASGPKVSDLEQAFSAVSGRKHLVSTNDLTSAVTMALHLAGVRAGDSVATIAFSCLQSNSPIARIGAHPVWIDIDPKTMSMSVADLEAKLNPSIKAVMVYHVAGYPADINSISSLCRASEIPLIEDCNNSIGATYNNQPVGLYGEYAIYSLYPNRQINGIDGGILGTPDSETAAEAIRLRRFGVDAKSFRDTRGEINPESDVPEIGWSAALNNLNAAIALSQLPTLKERTSRTITIAGKMTNALSDLNDVFVIKPVPGGVSAYWGFFILTKHRDALIDYLASYGIKSSIFHHRNDTYTGFNARPADLPGTSVVMAQALALPCGWWLTDQQVDYLIKQLLRFSPN